MSYKELRLNGKDDNMKVFFKIVCCIGVLVYFKTSKVSLTLYTMAALLLLGVLWKYVKKHRKRKKYINSPMSKVDKMDGHEFEEYLMAHFQTLGYKCKNVGKNGHDFGVDLVISRGGDSIAVQAKRYSSHVGIKAVQEVVSGQGYYGTNKAMVVTNNEFTASARALADKCNVILWDREECRRQFKHRL